MTGSDTHFGSDEKVVRGLGMPGRGSIGPLDGEAEPGVRGHPRTTS
jgi:hypothetical protein